MKKKLIAFLLAFSMVGSLAGCGGDDTGKKNGGGEKQDSEENQSGEENQGGDEEPAETVTLKIWIQSANQPEYFQWVKETFESQNKGIELKIEPQASSALGDTLDVTLGGDDAPDIVATWGGLVAATLYKGNRILEISDIITDEVEANFVEAATYNKLDGDGKYVSLPLGGFVSPVIYYNKTAFDSMGLSVPTTYDELKDVAAQIRAASKQPLIAGFNTWHLPHFMQAIHARTMTPENFAQLIGTPSDINPYELPGYKEGFDLLKQYNDDKIFADNITGYDANMAQMEFIAQNALMMTAPSLDLLTLSDAAEFELGAFLLPAGEVDGPLASGVYSDVLAINANSQYIDECKQLFEFLLTPEAQAKLLEFEILPIRKDVDISSANPIMSEVVAAMDKGVSGFYQSYSVSGVDVELVAAGSMLLTGQGDSAAAAQHMADYYKANAMQ